MAVIPQTVLPAPLPGVDLIKHGKVRGVYAIPDTNFLLVVASDRISIFDHVLNALVLGKGAILNALNIFWRQQLGSMVQHDLVAYGAGIDEYLPEALRGNPDLQARSTIVVRHQVLPVECIARGHLTGSGWRDYQETGMVSGHLLPEGLTDGSLLPAPLFTPSTKAEAGHDINIGFEEVVAKYGAWVERKTLAIFSAIANYARSRGIIVADGKFELSPEGVLLDEIGTPDACRFWLYLDWLKAHANGKLPDSLDKEYVRAFGKQLGINKRDPEKPEDIEYVHRQILASEVIAETMRRYRYIFWVLTGMLIETFQSDVLGISGSQSVRRVEVVLGSRSDLDQAYKGLQYLRQRIGNENIQVHVISCHRNPDALRQYALRVGGLAHRLKVDAIIAGAGMAAQLPGTLKAWLDLYGKSAIPVLGVGFKGTTLEADFAARLSIEQLPGCPVYGESDGRAYFGEAGFLAACEAALTHEFLTRQNTPKPYELNIQWQ